MDENSPRQAHLKTRSNHQLELLLDKCFISLATFMTCLLLTHALLISLKTFFQGFIAKYCGFYDRI